MNWDAGVNVKERRVELGLIAKDSQGKFMAARSVIHEIQADLTTAEALATVNTIMFCKELGFDNIIFESDTMQVIKAIAT
jgi:ribonuclease HI